MYISSGYLTKYGLSPPRFGLYQPQVILQLDLDLGGRTTWMRLLKTGRLSPEIDFCRAIGH